MKKSRALLGFAALMSMFAILASSASANFVSTSLSGSTTLKSAVAKFTLEEAGTAQLNVECPTLTGGAWKITTLKATKEILSGQFTKCTAEVGGLKKAATINSGCELKIVQKGGAGSTFTGGVQSNCSITRGQCVVTIAAGTANENLEKVVVVNSGANDVATSAVKGFTAAPNAECVALGVKATGGAFTAEATNNGQNVE
jgi:hypothetical protein